MMLVPEIALTRLLAPPARALRDRVAIFTLPHHGERFDEWSRLKRGEARVVIGTRRQSSRLFSNLGLVV